MWKSWRLAATALAAAAAVAAAAIIVWQAAGFRLLKTPLSPSLSIWRDGGNKADAAGGYTLDVNVNPPGGGTVYIHPQSDAYTYLALERMKEGTNVKVTAAENKKGGYYFAGWSGEITEKSNSVVVRMRGKKHKTLTANFVNPESPPDVSSAIDSIAMVFVKGGTDMATDKRVDDFYIGKYEVTQGLWRAVIGNDPSEFTGDDNLPVEEVSWYDAVAFIRELNARTGKKYRLPTDEEWGYAARGGPKRNKYKFSGSDNIDKVAWYADNSGRATHPVGTKRPNAPGIYDMSGNVSEWTSTDKADGAADAYPVYPIVRGGSWRYGAESNLNLHSYVARPDLDDDEVGFRLAHDADDKASADENTAAPKWYPPPYVSSNPDSVEMVFVEGGTFTMGCTAEQGDECGDYEKPAHSVTLGDFSIGKYEVTRGLWNAVMAAPYPTFHGRDNNPVRYEGWEEAYLRIPEIMVKYMEEFIQRLNAKTGRNYRLPTEAEWEYAARGGNKSKGYKYSGGDDIEEVAWYMINSGGTTRPAGTKAPNELGIHDMSGNVRELVSDWYGYGNYSSGHQVNPTGPSKDKGYYRNRVVRGGSWMYGPNGCRVSYRGNNDAGGYNYDYGFRLAHDK